MQCRRWLRLHIVCTDLWVPRIPVHLDSFVGQIGAC